jgi:hypothetical protein
MKIAVLGSSRSLSLAPFNEPAWEIWACSDGTVAIPRCELRFELHSIEFMRTEPRYKNGSALDDYLEYIKSFPVYMQDRHPDFPHSLKYPKDEMVRKHGPFFFTSSIAWMMALALERKPDEIGLWGVDMNAADEYGHQRPGFHYFYEMATRAGVKVTLPPGNTLLDRPKWEGFDD